MIAYKEEDVLKVNVLGTEYTITKGVKAEDDVALKHWDGYFDSSTKEIKILEFTQEPGAKSDLKNYENSVVRHELVHTFLFESGLDTSTDWARNEEIVDWMALQIPKMAKVFNELEIM